MTLDPMLGKALTLVIGLLLIGILVKSLQRYLANRIQNPDARYSARKLLGFVGYVAALLFAAGVFSANLSNLTIAVGVAGAGIAFALQEVIASVAGWIAISLGQFFKIGDRVQLGGIKGDVIDIGVLRTTLMEIGEWVKGDAYSGRIVRIANSFVFKEPVFNYSGDFPFVWDEISIPVRYGSDYRLARSILQQIAQEVTAANATSARVTWSQMTKKYRIEEASVDPMITLVANDNWAEFTLRYVVDYKRRRSTKDQLFTLILERFDASEGKIQLASASVELAQAPVINVKIRD